MFVVFICFPVSLFKYFYNINGGLHNFYTNFILTFLMLTVLIFLLTLIYIFFNAYDSHNLLNLFRCKNFFFEDLSWAEKFFNHVFFCGYELSPSFSPQVLIIVFYKRNTLITIMMMMMKLNIYYLKYSVFS